MTKKKTTKKSKTLTKTPTKKKTKAPVRATPKKPAAKKKSSVTIKPEVLEQVVPILEAIGQLSEAAYKGIRRFTISELKHYLDQCEEDISKAKKRGRKKGQTSATAELDDLVLAVVTKVGNSREDGRVVMRDLEPELPEHSDQQIRRALVRLTKQKLIKSEGSTKDKSYCAA